MISVTYGFWMPLIALKGRAGPSEGRAGPGSLLSFFIDMCLVCSTDALSGSVCFSISGCAGLSAVDKPITAPALQHAFLLIRES